MPTRIDETGNRYGRLTVVEFSHVVKYKYSHAQMTVPHWLCLCDCGNETITSGASLRSGNAQSCGCLRREVCAKNGKATFKHGLSFSSESSSYYAARQRCTNPNAISYDNYGGRGIEFRLPPFAEFYAHLGPKPEPKQLYSLERIDNEGHYEIGNVRWATDAEQAHNRRTNKLTSDDVVAIRKLSTYGITSRFLACKFGVTKGAVRDVVNNRRWKVSEVAA